METPRLWRYEGRGPTARVVCARRGHQKVPQLCPGLPGTACRQGYYGRPDWACTGRGGRCCACVDGRVWPSDSAAGSWREVSGSRRLRMADPQTSTRADDERRPRRLAGPAQQSGSSRG